MKRKPFLTGIERLRDRGAVVKELNEVLASEIVRVMRRRRERAAGEWGRADLIAQRIVQLGGEPDYSPAGFVLGGAGLSRRAPRAS